MVPDVSSSQCSVPQCCVISILVVAMGEPAGHQLCTSVPINATGDVEEPICSSSLYGLGAISKPTSAGRRVHTASPQNCRRSVVSEPRVLGLESISMSNLQGAGIASGCDTTSRVAKCFPSPLLAMSCDVGMQGRCRGYRGQHRDKPAHSPTHVLRQIEVTRPRGS